MSYACRDCPMKKEDCFREGCVTAGGHVRPITVANHMLPGPSIQVCEDDTIRVTVVNAFASESATIHWHGIHQVGTPFMDGTPFVTQCPIPPHNTFEYVFKASPAGTHIWHSHIGMLGQKKAKYCLLRLAQKRLIFFIQKVVQRFKK